MFAEEEFYTIAKDGQSIGSTLLLFGSSDGNEWTTEDWDHTFVVETIGRVNWGTTQNPGPFRKYCLDATQVSLAGLDLSGVRVAAPYIRDDHLRDTPYHRNMVLFDYIQSAMTPLKVTDHALSFSPDGKPARSLRSRGLL